MLSDNTDCSYEKDDQHLQGVATQFVSSVDLLLCARDDKLLFGFPVHRVIMLAHSPVLKQPFGRPTRAGSQGVAAANNATRTND